ncbi:glycerol-3-phosphate 1-O-acyltransferase PlsY [Mahella sp.]|uniref:glycerol-3-phosphate 1-O-acyltransferase PlsY n=1 Tax=Mahella sp. TaxID=2798721 RepID=UPI0025B9D347|nr:glycerol-3-phosphate 1-O-acyltransferase PlsY [Mahella sp.]MBZ4666599.1 acyl-phosphate glycerol-3-phosphate acyltransferase [Mahella sp.]
MGIGIAIIIGYLIGSISTALIVGRTLGRIDIRQYGSGNAGATNIARVLGKRAGAITLVFDLLKGVIAVLIGRWLGGQWGAVLAGMAAIIGHNWPVYFQFRGGKGVATTLGAALVISPLIGLLILLIAGVIILVTRYVSLGSIIAAIAYPILVLIISPDPWLILFSIFTCVMIIARHNSNIKRLLAGSESKLGEKAKKV